MMDRIIPACAGSTCDANGRPVRTADHPRMRGEHRADYLTRGVHWGSSPHARGAPLPRGNSRLRQGIIPACAGSTVSFVLTGGNGWDHPRMRGEHASYLGKA